MEFEYDEEFNDLNITKKLSLDINMSTEHIKPIILLPRIKIEHVVNKQELKDNLNDLECPICRNIYEDPRGCIKCESKFCLVCIQDQDSLGTVKICPSCRDQDKYLMTQDKKSNQDQILYQSLETQYIQCPSIFQDKLNSIQVICHNQGCNGVFKYNEREIHLDFCQYQIYDCPSNGCAQKVTKLSERGHIEVCEFRRIKCKYCSKEVQKNKILLHEDYCENNLKKCKGCNQDFISYLIEVHDKICKKNFIECEMCNTSFSNHSFDYHTKADCYRRLYERQIRNIKKKDKELSNKKKQLSNKDMQMNKITSMLQDLKQQLLSSEFNNGMLLQQLEEIDQISKQGLVEQQQSEHTEYYSDSFRVSEQEFSQNEITQKNIIVNDADGTDQMDLTFNKRNKSSRNNQNKFFTQNNNLLNQSFIPYLDYEFEELNEQQEENKENYMDNQIKKRIIPLRNNQQQNRDIIINSENISFDSDLAQECRYSIYFRNSRKVPEDFSNRNLFQHPFLEQREQQRQQLSQLDNSEIISYPN